MADNYTVTREGQETGAFVLREGLRSLGRLDYHLAGSLLNIDYVVVEPALRGQRLGVRLVDAAVDWARETGRSVHPYCGYAARVLRSDARYQDVLVERRV